MPTRVGIALSIARPRLVATLTGDARRAGEDALSADVNVGEIDPGVGDEKLAHLIRVRHATRLHDVERSVALAVVLEITYLEPRVDERRNANLRLVLIRRSGEVREERGDAVHLQEIEETNRHRLHVECRPCVLKTRDRIDDDGIRLQLLDDVVDRHEVLLEPKDRRAGGVKVKLAALHPFLEIDADRPHVPRQAAVGQLVELADAARRLVELRQSRRTTRPDGGTLPRPALGLWQTHASDVPISQFAACPVTKCKVVPGDPSLGFAQYRSRLLGYGLVVPTLDVGEDHRDR